MATLTKFYQWVQFLAGKAVDLTTGTSDTFYVLFTNTAPNVADTVVDTTTTPCTVKSTSNAVEIAAGNNYVKGGFSCGTVTGAQAGGVFKFTLGSDPTVTAAGGTIGPFQYVVLYCATAGSAAARPALGWYAYPTPVTLQIGEPFTVDLDQTNGVLTLA
jgi:hypothetical protein